ncbi:MAG: 50S ribosomal protein L17 [Candidatus Sumerlaeia bacterium]|nr:50S ribosomal protein L17 [Candidatus Sumerlaeia bacterium]
MRHRNIRSRLNRTSEHRLALMRNLAEALIERERIHTTAAKAKQLRAFVEPLITLGREGTLAARRQAFSRLGKKKAVHKLFTVLGPRFKERNGGYTRVVKAGVRAGDGAQMAYIEFVERTVVEPKEKKSKDARQRMRERLRELQRARARM